jgi:D-amino-acid dehydrogenase
MVVIGSPVPRSALVVGAGVVGVATAYALARRGVAVTVVDRANRPGSGASFANGGQLSYAYTDALANPGLLRHIPALVWGLDPAFRLRPGLDIGQITWLLRFLGNSSMARFHANTLAGLQLGAESRLAMHALLERHKLNFGHSVAGKMVIFQDPDTFRSARHMVALKRSHGAVQHLLSPAEAVSLEPALAARPGSFAGAVHSPEEELGDPHRFCIGLLDILQRDYGVELRLGTTIEFWEASQHSVRAMAGDGEAIMADQLFICAGIDARRLLKGTGLSSALMAMKGYSFTTAPGIAAPAMSITDVARKIVFCPLDGKLRVAGLAELGAYDTRIDTKRLGELVAGATAALPEAADYSAVGAGWAGIRPMTANSLPISRRVQPRVVVNVGHGMLGWTYAMGSAERAACL